MTYETSNDLIGVGWDVRGWQNNQQATAIVQLRVDTEDIAWLGVSKPFRFREGTIPGFQELIEPALRTRSTDAIRSSLPIAIAIDAPLGFPTGFRDLVAEGACPQQIPKNQIENRLAYRDCERWVKSNYKKSPLSAPFDKLGNNATLAISVSRQLECDGFTLVPQSALISNRAIIEVYPALAKVGPKKTDRAAGNLARHLPQELEVGTDQYDAAICALLGLVYLGGGPALGLPELIPFPKTTAPEEGWIFAPPPEFISNES